MSRPIDPNSRYRVKPHVLNGYVYASTQPPAIDPQTGKKKYRHVHWGKVSEGKFLPALRYLLASPEEKSSLIFPKEWDLSELSRFSGSQTPDCPVYGVDDQNRLYGDIWLLEQVADKTELRHDLLVAFNGDSDMVDSIITLAMFPYLTKYTYNRVERWQRVERTPCRRPLTPRAITELTQSITEQHRMDFLRQRAARLGKEEMCAIDSTSRSAFGESLADIKWGKNKDMLPLQQTTEVVVYTLSSHMPVYYRTFPGNMPDSRSLDIVLADLDHADFRDLVLITDRGYDSLRNMERYILKRQAMIMCVKTGQKMVMDKIVKLGDFGLRPEGMELDLETGLYHRQYDIDYAVGSTHGQNRMSDRLKLNLYLDGPRRASILHRMELDIAAQERALCGLMEDAAVADGRSIADDFGYFTVVIDKKTRTIQSYARNEKKIAKARLRAGFFASVTHKLGFDAMTAYRHYRLRDEQEKYFQQMKDQMVADRQRNWSEEGKTGRLLVLFVSLIMASYVRHVWKRWLRKKFSSSLEILDEMRSIRCIEHTNQKSIITPFVGAQLDICHAFGFEIPAGCDKSHVAPTQEKRKRGRPSKSKEAEGL